MYEILKGFGHEHFWTAGTDQGEEGSFFWLSTGRPVTFTVIRLHYSICVINFYNLVFFLFLLCLSYIFGCCVVELERRRTGMCC